MDGARDWSRTSTRLPPLGPEPSASTNSATRAMGGDYGPLQKPSIGVAPCGVSRLRAMRRSGESGDELIDLIFRVVEVR